MEFWALENASEELICLFGVSIIVFFGVAGVVLLIDYVKRKQNDTK